MPTAKTPATAKKLVASAAESTNVTRTRRVRLSKALAAKPAEKFAGMATSVTLPKPNGAKSKKLKLVSDRYKLPDNEYANLMALKKRLLLLGVDAKKGQLLRAGLMLLVSMSDIQLKQAVAKVEIIKEAPPPKTTN